jgi:hypothetical protein
MRCCRLAVVHAQDTIIVCEGDKLLPLCKSFGTKHSMSEVQVNNLHAYLTRYYTDHMAKAAGSKP